MISMEMARDELARQSVGSSIDDIDKRIRARRTSFEKFSKKLQDDRSLLEKSLGNASARMKVSSTDLQVPTHIETAAAAKFVDNFQQILEERRRLAPRRIINKQFNPEKYSLSKLILEKKREEA
mmetsp:Transcript_13741/g.22685  ORF Transcript_13741/g.22685 Transcript_13741/m.22685 type:complete len:124 (-) Transcript_13741:184-555(-)